MNFILKLYRKLVPEKVRRACNVSLQKMQTAYKNKRAMEVHRYGDLHKDKTFYVIYSQWPQTWGLATTVSIVVNNIKYAVEHGWIPVVDLKRCYIPGIQNEEHKGKENAWEYYFEQPIPGYSLEEVYQSRRVILAPDKGQPYGSMDWKNMQNLSDEMYTPYFEAVAKYVRIRPDILERAQEIRRTLFGRAGGGKILGIGMRAGLYWGEAAHTEMYVNHPRGLNIDEYIEYAHRYMREFGCEYIFLSPDDRYYMKRMKQEFGEKCLYLEGRTLPRYFDDEGNPLSENEGSWIENDNQSIEERSVDYLIETYLLSTCDALFRVQGGGSVLACLLNNRRYENYYMVDRGVYRG